MKKLVISTLLALATIVSFAQSSVFRPRIEIAEVESEVGGVVDTALEVFYMNDESPRMYYLSLGHLGFGNDIVQVDIDPLTELFIPLGNTVSEALAKLEEIKALYNNMDRLEKTELTGCFSILYPDPEKTVTVTVTRRQLLSSKLLEFSVPIEGSDTVLRARHISKSDFSQIVGSVKFYKKLHPKQ